MKTQDECVGYLDVRRDVGAHELEAGVILVLVLGCPLKLELLLHGLLLRGVLLAAAPLLDLLVDGVALLGELEPRLLVPGGVLLREGQRMGF